MFSVVSNYISEKRRIPPLDSTTEESVKDKIVLITGANSGIGKCTAEEMGKRGATVIMACRNMIKGQEALDDIKKRVPDANLVLLQLDLEDLDNVRKFAREFKEKYSKIDILINNAGVYYTKPRIGKTKHGFEEHMGINHLGPFLLTLLLLDLVKAGSPSRIIFVASSMHQIAKIQMDDLMLEKARSLGLSNLLPYANSKWANMLTCRELSKRLEGSGVTTYCLCPGMVGTNLFTNQVWWKRWSQVVAQAAVGLTPEKGAETTLYVSLQKGVEKESGFMYRFNRKWEKACKMMDENEELGRELWEKSEELVGLKN